MFWWWVTFSKFSFPFLRSTLIVSRPLERLWNSFSRWSLVRFFLALDRDRICNQTERKKFIYYLGKRGPYKFFFMEGWYFCTELSYIRRKLLNLCTSFPFYTESMKETDLGLSLICAAWNDSIIHSLKTNLGLPLSSQDLKMASFLKRFCSSSVRSSKKWEECSVLRKWPRKMICSILFSAMNSTELWYGEKGGIGGVPIDTYSFSSSESVIATWWWDSRPTEDVPLLFPPVLHP